MNTQKVTNERAFTSTSEIMLDEEGIMHVHVLNGAEIGIDDMKELYKMYTSFGFGPGLKKGRMILTGINTNFISKEAKDYTEKYSTYFFSAYAIVCDSPFKRFTHNSLKFLLKPNSIFKMFSEKSAALTWLKSYPTIYFLTL